MNHLPPQMTPEPYIKVYFASIEEVEAALPPDRPELSVSFIEGSSVIVTFPSTATHAEMMGIKRYLERQGFEVE